MERAIEHLRDGMDGEEEWTTTVQRLLRANLGMNMADFDKYLELASTSEEKERAAIARTIVESRREF